MYLRTQIRRKGARHVASASIKTVICTKPPSIIVRARNDALQLQLNSEAHINLRYNSSRVGDVFRSDRRDLIRPRKKRNDANQRNLNSPLDVAGESRFREPA